MGNKGGKEKKGGGGKAADNKGNITTATGPAPPKPAKRFKILLIGDSTVGKSSMLLRFVDDTFTDAFITSIGAEGDFKKAEIKVGPPHNTTVTLEIWDTGGQERFRTITSSFYQGANGVVIMYDITNQESWVAVQKWTVETDRYAPEAAKLIVGNKLDLAKDRQVQQDEAREFASQSDIPYMEVSAKEPTLGGGNNVHKAFEQMAISILDKCEED